MAAKSDSTAGKASAGKKSTTSTAGGKKVRSFHRQRKENRSNQEVRGCRRDQERQDHRPRFGERQKAVGSRCAHQGQR